MNHEFRNKCIARILIAAVVTVYCGFAEFAQAQAAQSQTQQVPMTGQQESVPQTNPAQQPAADTQSAAPSTQPQSAPTGVVNPSEGPLTPVPPSTQTNTGELPNSPGSAPAGSTAEQQRTSPLQQPVGAAAAQVGPTAGGAASKPAGNAIAPAKQRQTRSFLIKLGAIAAAGVAVGTIAALSRGTSSKPPGTR